MKTKLSVKLFGAFFLILAIVVGAMILWRYLFFLNFKQYIRQVELEKLQAMVPALQKEYRTRGGWQGVAAEKERWQRLLGEGADIRKEVPPPPLEDGRRNASSRIVLTDARHRSLIGTPEADGIAQQVPIEVEGNIVGWLGLRKREPFKSGLPADLLNRLSRQHYLLAGAVIGLTALIALLFSRHLLQQVHRLIRGTRQLADRNFSARIEPTTADELGQLAENFNAMAQTLENYEKSRRQWLTDISHELRTPLAVLRAEIEALQDGVRKPTPSNLSSLHAEILRIGRLVEDLHLLSMADSDNLCLDRLPIRPCEVLEHILDRYRPRFVERRIAIETVLAGVEQTPIRGDADRLGQVFTNLFENVFRYVASPGSLKISGAVENHLLTILFEDSGPGVPEEALPRLFDRLYRVEASRNRASGGSGLGLSICRHIIEIHGGSIWAAKSPQGGLSIGIHLPLAERGAR